MIQLQNGTALGYDEVVDTLGDALQVAEVVHDAVQDGVVLSDIAALFTITPLLNEIRLDFPKFKAQLADMTPDESQRVAIELVNRHGGSPSTIVQKALDAVDLASRWHQVIEIGVDLAKDTIEFGKGIFKKDEPAEA